jgi:phenylacetate-CoA ligase
MKTDPKVCQDRLLEKINTVIDYALIQSPYYKRLFKQIRFKKEIKNISQFESIPITSRKVLAQHNDDFIAVPKEAWADLVITTGSTGKPIYIPFTKKDVFRNANFIAKKFSTFGLRKDDIAYITVPIEQSMWIGGLSVWLGCLKTGTTALRVGNVGVEKHMEFMERFKPSVIFGLPSYILRLGEELRIRKSLKLPGLRLIVTFGENVMNKDFSRNILGSNIEKLWGAKVISGYGATEASPGFECLFQSGHHILSEMLYVEIVDPKTLKVLKTGEEGLVVITHFGREGLPLIRYANGDISFIDKARCKCGRIMPRLGPVLGRIDEMVKIKGVNIYPSRLQDFLLNTSFVQDFLIELFTDKNFCDRIKIYVKFFGELSKKDKEVKLDYLKAKFKEKLGITIEFQELRTLKEKNSLRIKKSYIIDERRKYK